MNFLYMISNKFHPRLRIGYLILLIFIALAVSCNLVRKKPVYEGSIHYKISYSGNLGQNSSSLLPSGLELYFKNNVLKLKPEGGLGKLEPTVIIDGTKGTVNNIDYPDGNLITRKLLPKDTSLIKTGDEEKIAGYRCRIYKATNK